MKQLVTIYAIVRTETGDAYVGSTAQKTGRWRTHRSKLRTKKHHCSHLQRAWDKYGEGAFILVDLHEQECQGREERYVLETAWIAERGTYNTLIASERAGVFTISEGDKQRRRETMLAKVANDAAFRARLETHSRRLVELARTPAARAAMSVATRASWDDPDMRARRRSGQERRWGENAEASKAAQADKMSAHWASEETRKAHGAKLRAQWDNPDSKIRNRSEGRWADPEAKVQQAEKMRAVHATRRAAKQQP